MKRVLLFATTTGYQIRSFGEAADRLGVRLVFASDRCDQLDDPWWDGAIPIRFHDPDASMEAIAAALSASPPDGVLAVGDRPTPLAARAAALFGLPGNPVEAAEASRNKLATRRLLRAAGLPTPSFEVVAVDDDAAVRSMSVGYPVVIKPLALSGSRGVMRVDDAHGLAAAFARLKQLLQAPDIRVQRDRVHDVVLIETFVPGREFAVEGVLTRGVLTAWAIFDKPDPLDGPFFEETIYVTPSGEEPAVQAAIVETVAAATKALGLAHGPVHAECRVNADGVYVLEVAARPIGGLCSKALRLRAPDGSLASLEEVLLRHAVGENVAHYDRERVASGVMMIPIPRRGIYRDVDGVEAAQQVAGVEEVRITAKRDAVLVPLPEGRSYLGFIFARGESPAAVEGALRAAHAKLQFAIDREIALIQEAGDRRQETEGVLPPTF